MNDDDEDRRSEMKRTKSNSINHKKNVYLTNHRHFNEFLHENDIKLLLLLAIFNKYSINKQYLK